MYTLPNHVATPALQILDFNNIRTTEAPCTSTPQRYAKLRHSILRILKSSIRTKRFYARRYIFMKQSRRLGYVYNRGG